MKKVDVFGINFSVADYNSASDLIIKNAKENKSFSMTALAVHGLVESMLNKELFDKVSTIDLIVPDGQPIKWAMNNLCKLKLKDRVCGPELVLHTLKKASKEKLKVYLYGSTENTIELFSKFITTNYSGVILCGTHIDRFRDATEEEDIQDIEKINNTGAQIVLVGRGCPRQECWVADHKNKITAAMLAVGAAFDFHAGLINRPSKRIQDLGLEWLYRLYQEPNRLWKRYFFTNTYFIYSFLKFNFFNRSMF